MQWRGPLPCLPRPHLFVDVVYIVTQQPPHFGYWDPGVGAYDPKFERGRDFCTMHLTTNSHHPMSEVVVLRNKQTLLKTSTLLRYAMPEGNNQVIFFQSS